MRRVSFKKNRIVPRRDAAEWRVKMDIKRILAKIIAGAMIFTSAAIPELPQRAAAATVTGWSVGKGATGDADADGYIDTEVKYSGTGSFKAWNHSKDAPGVDKYATIATVVNGVKKGKTYKWGFMAKSLNSTYTQAYIDWGPPRISLQPFSGTYDWTPYEFTYTHTGDASQVTLRIAFEDYIEAFWIDDVYFYEIEDGARVGKNLITNPDFDEAPIVDDIKKDNVEPVSSMVQYLEKSGMIPIYKADSITIDGDFSDWDEKFDRIPMNQAVSIGGGRVDMSASIALAWDDKYLYIATEADDDKHEAISGGSFWMGDCMQVSLSQDIPGRVYGTEMGFDYIKETNASEVNQQEHPDMQFKAQMDGTVIRYEIAIPWALAFGERPESCLFNALVNDTDDGSRKYCLELDPRGISYDKSAVTNPRLVMYDNPSDVPFISSVSGPVSLPINSEGTYQVSVFNTSDSEKTFKITRDDADETELTLGAHTSGAAEIKHNFDKSGNVTLNFKTTDGENEQSMAKVVNVSFDERVPSKEEAEQMLQKLDNYVKDIEPLMTECEFMGYDLVYEKSDAYLLQRFAELNRSKIEAGNYNFITYQYTKLTEIYENLKKQLEGIIKGEITPFDVPQMVTSDDKDIIDGQSFIRDVEYQGKVSKRPYFYVGTGHWNYVWNDLENLKTLGYDYIHIEIGPNSVIYPESFAANWNVHVLGAVPDYSVELQEKEVHNGKYAAKIVNNTPYNYNNFVTVRQTVKVEPNTVYEFGVSAKATDAPNSLKLNLGSMPYNDRISMGGTYGWTDYSGTYMSGPNDETMDLVITSDAPVPAFYFDDAYVRKQGDDKNLLKNEGFEEGSNDPDSIGDGMKAVYTNIERLQKVFEKAEELDMSIDLLITPHYFPTFLATKDPTINDGGKVPTQFMPFNPTHPTVRKVLEKYIEILVPMVKDYKSLQSIVLSNEPAWNSNLGTYYLPAYRDYLREKYNNDINVLNEAYGGSEYKDFDSIGWPRSMNASKSWNDYTTFNNAILAEYHAYLAAAVRKIDPTIPLHTKQMMTMLGGKPSWNRLETASDYELWLDSLDINGNDGGAAGFNSEDAGNRGIFVLESWYDYLTSVKDAPCVNSEDHILSATDVMNYGEFVPDQVAAQVWQGAVHGRGGTNLWLWEVKEFGENNSLLTNRPMVVSKTTKAGFDLNRAAYEVTALQKTKRRVAIMQSNYTNQASDNTYNAYAYTNKCVLLNGLRPFWLTDRNYKNIHNYDLVILPDTICVSDEAFAEIKKYAENGGKLLILGKNALSMDENSVKRDEAEVQKVKDLAMDVVNVAYLGYLVQNLDEVRDAIENAISTAGLDTIIVRDAETNEKVDTVEWLAGSYDGDLVVNLHNTSMESDKTVYIEVDGKRIDSFRELRSDKEYEDGVITLKTYQPVIVKFDIDNPFIDTYGHWAKDTITSLYQKGIVNGRTASEFDPQASLTGGEIATLIAKAAGIEINAADSDKNWYDAAVRALTDAGIADGELDEPTAAVTRESIAKLCVRAIEYKSGNEAKGGTISYSDKADISADKTSYVEKALGMGIMKGYDTNKFMPKSLLTRAEMTVVIENMLKVL